MVLGLKSKHKKGNFIRLEYIVHVNEVRPWPPSEPLKSVQTVLLQWENGTDNSGSFLSVAGHSNIVFNESFVLPLILYQKKSSDKFRKNYLEFSLFEPRKDKAKQQLLGTAILNLADYALFDEILSVDVPFNFKKSSDNWGPPALSISLELVERDSSNSSPSVGFSKEASLDNDDDDDDSGIVSLTDDDAASSHSSRTTGSSTFEVALTSPSWNEKNGYGNVGIDHTKDRNKYSRPLSSHDPSSDTWNKVKDYVSLSKKFSERSLSYVKRNSTTPMVISSPISVSYPDNNERLNSILASSMRESSYNDAIFKNTQQTVEEKFTEKLAIEATSVDNYKKNDEKSNFLHKLVNDGHVGWDELNEKISEDASKKTKIALRSDTIVSNRKGQAVPPSGSNKARIKHVNSVQIKELKSDVSDGSKNEWKIRAEMLEEELKETAVIEVALYSVVAEHSSSVNKVHAPARRLSRFYNNACRSGSQAKRASVARAAISGLVLVSKACGNDVPRLTFWLSNAIMLRSIVSQTAAELPDFNGTRQQTSKLIVESDDCEDVLTLIMAIEKVESWLFSRIVESVWWQSFTPHMLPTVAKGSNRERGRGGKKTSGRRNCLGDHEQGTLSIELWKKAFKDACEKICPIRAVGHQCGCLSALVILVMEQLVNRLDMAMFNAILRESAEEMPTDPVSDPISDSKVLPVPAGKSSFGAGAQLKNVIGNWSRWLSDLFGLEDESTDDIVIHEEGKRPKSFKAFRLLHALSDLMMLPFGMLADVSTRKEVCPMFGPTIIRRVLSNFVPDEFSPNPIPRKIINALDSEEISDSSIDLMTSFPCTATPTKYSPPSAALLSCVGEVGSQVLKSSRLSTLEKSYTSDDDVDELDSPLTSIIPDSYQSSSALARLSLMPKEKGGNDIVRYQLLREIWRDDEQQ
ncbi:hypothetical protein CASFOL_006270 [Castilleja foliolosa]|uniref:C2 NT-type domain-containing protein n=1 Tax=Castilleja foliolosa TaxID=1961234 RepID=A0ABD3E7Z0_9LAMI